MKIIKKPKILPIECTMCGGVFIPKLKEIKKAVHPTNTPYIVIDPDETRAAYCPFCTVVNEVRFEKGADDYAKGENQ